MLQDYHPSSSRVYFSRPRFSRHRSPLPRSDLFPVVARSFSLSRLVRPVARTATAGSDGVQCGRPIFDDFFQHLWPCIGNNTANVVFQRVKRLWIIRIDQ
ncbi:hypothetical protein TNCV_3486681 [Trichonephila clavipes]|nr:hypothetical protein TNCV_3486681 [Trichonephila clavipes]